MSTVGWDPEANYTNEEIEAFATKAMQMAKDSGQDVSVDLSRFGTKFS